MNIYIIYLFGLGCFILGWAFGYLVLAFYIRLFRFSKDES